MKIAFYYHIPIASSDKGILLAPSYLGVFFDALAKEITHLYLVMHETPESQLSEADYELKQQNITWINLGLKTPAWHRVFFHKKILKSKLSEIELCDVMLVRSPSPLAPFFDRYLRHPKLSFMVVGDYKEGLNNMKNGGVRELAIKGLLIYIHLLFQRKLRNADVVVNSPALYDQYKATARNISLIKTTTLSTADFFERNDTCENSRIEVIFTGRLDRAKGLFELVEAVANLRKENFDVRCNIVGIEVSSSSKGSVKQSLIDRAKELGIEEFLIFHGWKSVGAELNSVYRMADIYVIPSYHEGFPRTIWEAMANSLPVIATKVGAIPHYLEHEVSAIIINPKDSHEIKGAIIRLVQNKDLRQSIIHNGFQLAKEATQEKQILLLINFLKGLTLSKKNESRNR